MNSRLRMIQKDKLGTKFNLSYSSKKPYIIRSDKKTYEFEAEGNDCCYEKKSDIKHYNAESYPYGKNHMFAIDESFYEKIKTLTNNSTEDDDVSMSHI